MEKDYFKLGQYNFSIDYTKSTIEVNGNLIEDLTIKTSEEEFEELSENEDFEFEWGLYSPEFYIRGLEINANQKVEINEENCTNYEIALYFMEHCDSFVNISIENNYILIDGTVDIFGEEYPIDIKISKIKK